MFPSIFKDEISTDHFIEDADEGNHYLREMHRADPNASPSQTIHKRRTPLLLALLLTPFYLLFQFRITNRSFNRRLVLESFAHSCSYKTPLVLEIERSIWRSLITLADAAVTPYEALDQLVSNLPWSAIEAASNSPRDRRMFCMPPGNGISGCFLLHSLIFCPSISPALSFSHGVTTYLASWQTIGDTRFLDHPYSGWN